MPLIPNKQYAANAKVKARKEWIKNKATIIRNKKSRDSVRRPMPAIGQNTVGPKRPPGTLKQQPKARQRSK